MARQADQQRIRAAEDAKPAIDLSQVIAAYARWAPIYDLAFGLYTRGPRRAAIGAVNRLPAGRVLELGVGTGISLPDYDRKHCVTGIDVSPEMLARARARVREQRLDHVAALEEMDAEHLAFADGSFDVAVAMFFITVVPDPEQALREMVRVVRPGGRIVILGHFAAAAGPRAFVEQRLARHAARLGWRADDSIDAILARPELRLLERRPFKALGLFTLLVFARL